jgi:hypothetical protein
MSQSMRVTELEQRVIEALLTDHTLTPIKRTLNFDAITVADRHFTGPGFMTTLAPSDDLKLFTSDISLCWSRVGATVNSSVLTGYVVYVDRGWLNTIEGFVYAPAEWWPGSIEQIELFDEVETPMIPQAGTSTPVRVSELEQRVIEALLADRTLAPMKRTLNFDAITVADTDANGHGFMTHLEPSEELRLFDDDVSLRWGRVGAMLNSSVLTGYVVYVDDGRLNAIEGFVYDGEWPSSIEHIELVAGPVEY